MIRNPLISRRQALWRSGMGMGALGLAGVLRGLGAVQPPKRPAVVAIAAGAKRRTLPPGPNG